MKKAEEEAAAKKKAAADAKAAVAEWTRVADMKKAEELNKKAEKINMKRNKKGTMKDGRSRR